MREYLLAIVIEAVVRKIKSNVDEFWCAQGKLCAVLKERTIVIVKRVGNDSPTQAMEQIKRVQPAFYNSSKWSVCIARWAALCVMGWSGLAGAQSAQEELDDLSGRIEYAFYVGDTATLQQAVQSLEKLTATEAQQSELSFARWKLAQLQLHANREEAERVADACVAIEPPKISALQQAFVAACLSMLEELRPLRSRWYRSARDERMKQALQLNARSAQIQFVSAWIQVEREPTRSESYDALRKALASFDEGGNTTTQADRGHAEALYLAGKLEFVRHDLLAARNALERATVLVPDYRDAQELLKKVTMN